MANFDTTAYSSSQNLTMIQPFLQYPQQNYKMVNQSNQQSSASFNYYNNNPQTGNIGPSTYNNEGSSTKAVAVVRSVIAVIAFDDRNKVPQFMSQDSSSSAASGNYRTPTNGSEVAVDRSIASANMHQSTISMNRQAEGMAYFGNQQLHNVDYNYNNQYQHNNEYSEAMTPPYVQEETNNVATTAAKAPQHQMISVNPSDFPGELNFDFLINREEDRKKSFVYSKLLRKVFISMKKTLPVQFSWQTYPSNLRVRACMTFKDSHSLDKPVQRCLAHKASDLPENEAIEPLQLKFTFRTNQWGSFYEEDAKGFLSIVTPVGLPNPGRDYFQIDYQYFCMTSCVTGINRRATFLVFTLENESGRVLGRRSLPIQICCCPKRDMEKEEGRILDPDPAVTAGEKKKLKSRKIITQPYSDALQCWTAQPPTGIVVPQPTSYLPKPSSNYPTLATSSSYPPPMSAQIQSTINCEEDEVFHLNLKILGAQEYLGLLEFTYRLLLRDGQENNKLDKHREALNVIRLKIDEFKRVNSSSALHQ